MVMVIDARIFDVLGETLFCSLTMVYVCRHELAFIMDGWAYSDHN